MCEHLIVAVSTDELTESYKAKRPVIPFQDRIEIVKAVKFVDEVVVQEDRDKIKAHQKYGFDALFVGDDWKGDEMFIRTEKYLKERGGEVVYFPRTEGVSSRMLSEKVK